MTTHAALGVDQDTAVRPRDRRHLADICAGRVLAVPAHDRGRNLSCAHNKEPGSEPGVQLSRNLGRNRHVGKRAGNLAGPAANTLFSVSQYEGVQSLQLQRSSLPNRSSASQSQPQTQKSMPYPLAKTKTESQ